MGYATYSLDLSNTAVGFAIWHLGRVFGLCGQRPKK